MGKVEDMLPTPGTHPEEVTPPPQLTWEVVNSGAWLLTSVTFTSTSHVLLRPETGGAM